jgi:hypothetical protein
VKHVYIFKEYHSPVKVIAAVVAGEKIKVFTDITWCRNMSVCIAKGAGHARFHSRQGKVFLISTASRPTLEPAAPPIQWVPGAIFPGDKAAGA